MLQYFALFAILTATFSNITLSLHLIFLYYVIVQAFYLGETNSLQSVAIFRVYFEKMIPIIAKYCNTSNILQIVGKVLQSIFLATLCNIALSIASVFIYNLFCCDKFVTNTLNLCITHCTL